jgi:hypothetical protein
MHAKRFASQSTPQYNPWQSSRFSNTKSSPARMDDVMAKLQSAADPKFNSPIMLKSVRLFRGTIRGPDR